MAYGIETLRRPVQHFQSGGSTTTETITREAPEIEAIRLALLRDAQQIAGQPIELPDFQVSDLSPLQQQANVLAQQGIGTFQPFLDQAAATTGLGTGTVSEGVQTSRGALGTIGTGAQGVAGGFTPVAAGELAATGGLGTLAGGIQGLDPQAFQAFFDPFTPSVIQQAEQDIARQGDIQRNVLNAQAANAGAFGGSRQGIQGLDPQAFQAFFDPFTTSVIQQAEQDLARQGAIQQNQLNANAVGAGAFGGSRQGIQDTELARNILDQQARTAAQLRLAGFGQSQQLAQNRAAQLGQLGLGQLQGAQTLGQLGAQRGSLGTQIGQLGAQQANVGRAQGALGQAFGQLGQVQGQLGEAQSNLQAQDLQNLASLGQTQLQQNQALLDARRQNVLQRQFEPFQRVSFLSDIQARTPSAQQTLTTATSPGVSPFQQAAGLGIAGLSAASGARNLNLF